MIIFLILGLIFIFVGIWIHRKRKLLIQHGERIIGVVIRNVESETNGRVLYFPIVEIEETTGKKSQLKMTIGTNVYRKIGSNIELVYDPNNPNSSVFEYSTSRSKSSLLFIIIGSIFTFIGAIGIILTLVINNIISN